ncbi:YbaB/EbfC family nucleoid-associated protein [Goodfellowiella coeruleoviolacea]|uniref:YbaB/EbfC DNA-binding family protein n=1 Tax=Goodfellowiella coeruleoviolacea TaxID=334858 RepID=A0AAE3G9J9_9PSEU|nr:YbaB/EbfC family nucleoid-associated protein [Goodfellowiella coeruleoviolacea]MCP2163242.1 YbaB/EbfC DNA-binding family protein [Goodfellowiella coeruleoviolacea]
MDPAQWLAGYENRLASAAEGARAASENLRQAGGSATSPRGEVTVTVNAAGALTDLTLTPAARTYGADHLARLILATARQAQQAASGRVSEIMREYLGEGPAFDQVSAHLSGEVGR